MNIYKELILQNCAGIVNKVLGGMEHYKVGTGKIPVAKSAVLYRWWFPENSEVVKILSNWKGSDLLAGVQTREFEGTTYYALYFGKSNNGYRRFCQHSTGNVHISTLRRTIHSLLTDDAYNKSIHEPEITNLLKACYFEWTEISQEEANLVECLEALCIVHGVYPLNIDGNSAINENWLRYMMKERGKVKDK
jgi:hypothetical protein